MKCQHSTYQPDTLAVRMCQEPGCHRKPAFNYITGTGSLYCRKHAKKGMVSMTRRCLMCTKYANYNYPGLVARYCKQHAPEGSVPARTCELCTKVPTYGYRGGKRVRCRDHFELGMIDLIHDKCILCNKQARYDIRGVPPGCYCYTHARQRIELIGPDS